MRRTSSERAVNLAHLAASRARKARIWPLARRLQSSAGMRAAAYRRPQADEARTINARILDEIERASFHTRYRLADFASVRGRSDLAAVHRFFERKLGPCAERRAGRDAGEAGEVLAALESFLIDPACLRPYIHAGTLTRNEYLRDLAELALALAASLDPKIC